MLGILRKKKRTITIIIKGRVLAYVFRHTVTGEHLNSPRVARFSRRFQARNLFAPSSQCAWLAFEEFIMKAMSFVFVVVAAGLFAGCSEDKPKPAAEPAKPATATTSSANAPSAPAKTPEKKDEGGW